MLITVLPAKPKGTMTAWKSIRKQSWCQKARSKMRHTFHDSCCYVLLLPPRSQEQSLCGSGDALAAHGALTKSLSCLALFAHHVSAWCEGHDGTVLEAHWTSAAGAFPGLLGLCRLQLPCGGQLNLVAANNSCIDIHQAKFVQPMCQNLKTFLGYVTRFMRLHRTAAKSSRCLMFTLCREVLHGFLEKRLVGRHRRCCQLLGEGHWSNTSNSNGMQGASAWKRNAAATRFYSGLSWYGIRQLSNCKGILRRWIK